MFSKLPVGILGATGIVGQRFVQMLEHHPWFEVAWLAASDRSEGKAYADAAAQFILDTPGPTTPNLKSLAWSRLNRPTFPLDANFKPSFTVISRAARADR